MGVKYCVLQMGVLSEAPFRVKLGVWVTRHWLIWIHAAFEPRLEGHVRSIVECRSIKM